MIILEENLERGILQGTDALDTSHWHRLVVREDGELEIQYLSPAQEWIKSVYNPSV